MARTDKKSIVARRRINHRGTEDTEEEPKDRERQEENEPEITQRIRRRKYGEKTVSWAFDSSCLFSHSVFWFFSVFWFVLCASVVQILILAFLCG
jgi:hypothetical protein